MQTEIHLVLLERDLTRERTRVFTGGKEAVRLVCLDFPLSHAAQMQLEGRIKRPLAQPDVEAWHLHRIISQGMPRVGVKHDTVDQALQRVMALKEEGADEIFASEEELETRLGASRPSSYGDNARTTMNSLLTALMGVCRQWAKSEPPEERNKRVEEAKQRQLERKRKLPSTDA